MKSPICRLSAADYQAFEKFAIRRLTHRSRWFRLVHVARFLYWMLLSLGLFGLFGMSSHLEESAKNAMQIWATLIIVSVGLFFVTVSVTRQVIVRELFSKSGAMQQPFEMTLGSQGLELFVENGYSRFSWAAIEEIEIAARHGYLFLSPMRAFILPTAAFEDLASFQAFIGEAKKLKAGYPAAASPR